MPQSEIEAVIAALDARMEDQRVLELLDNSAIAIVSHDLIHRLLPYAERLRHIDYSNNPLAAVPAATAVCAIDRSRGRELLRVAHDQLQREGDRIGEGLACFVEGLEELSEGRVESAQELWIRARPLLDGLSANRMIGAHQALAAFIDGNVALAGVLADQALWGAQKADDARAQVICCMVLGLVHLVTGRFSLVDHHLALADVALVRVPPEDRYELPMIHLERATIAWFRGDVAAAEANYEAAIDTANAQHNSWYEAIARAARAERTAHAAPIRAMQDAQEARTYFEAVDETWWIHAASLGYARAHLELGNLSTAQVLCDAVLDSATANFDRGRALLVAAEVAHETNRHESVAFAESAIDSFRKVGAHYWMATSEMWLASHDTRSGEFHRRRANSLTPAQEANDPAWQRLLRGSATLQINLLGQSSVAVDGKPVTFKTQAELELVAMLALSRNGIAKSVVADRIWPADDPVRVAHRIDNLTSAIRRRLAPAHRLRQRDQQLYLDLLPGECDARDIVATIPTSPSQPEPTASDRRRLAALLRGRLLGGLEVPWLLVEQLRIDRLARQLELDEQSDSDSDA